MRPIGLFEGANSNLLKNCKGNIFLIIIFLSAVKFVSIFPIRKWRNLLSIGFCFCR